MYRNSDVFVIDDDQAVADTVSAILRHIGLAVETFYDGPSLLRRIPDCVPDVLISDVMMPEMDGVSLAERVRVLCPGCSVILFSGNAAVVESLQETDEKTPAFEILMKPVPPAQLIGRVQSLLMKSKLQPASARPRTPTAA